MSKNKFKNWFQTTGMQKINKIANRRHLSVLRDSFATIMPLVIVSGLALIMGIILFGAGPKNSSLMHVIAKWTGYNEDGNLTGAFADISVIGEIVFKQGLFGGGIKIMSILIAFCIGFFLAKSRKDNSPEFAGLISIASFFILTGGGISKVEGTFFGAEGVFVAIIGSLVAAELYCFFSKNSRLQIIMPQGVPPAVGRAFSKLLPIIFTLTIVSLIFGVVAVPTYFAKPYYSIIDSEQIDKIVVKKIAMPEGGYWSIGDLIKMAIQAPFLYVVSSNGGNLGLALLFTFLVGLFWFFGIHGQNVLGGIFEPLFIILVIRNGNLVNEGGFDALQESGTIFNKGSLPAYITLGGAMTTLPFILVSLKFSKLKQNKEVMNFSLPAGVFNVNEPVVFGLPLVLNFIYLVPIIFTMPILILITYFFHLIFNPTLAFVQIPWTMPFGIGALFATGFDYLSFILVIINMIVAGLIWLPFILLENRYSKDKVLGEKSANELKELKTTLNWKNVLLILLPSTFIVFIIIALATTFGSNEAGKIMGILEGCLIMLVALAISFKSLWINQYQNLKAKIFKKKENNS